MVPLKRSQTFQRWFVLVFSCVAMLGSYYCYDIPSALAKQIEDDLDISEVKQNLLYSVYSFPNTILPLFGGYFVDKFGTAKTLFVFSSLLAIGQSLFAVGISSKNYLLMVVGRIFFGFGGESQSVAQSTLTALWFQDKELAMALGINLSVSRLGSVWNDNMSPFMYKHGGLSAAAWFGFFVCIVSIGAVIMLIIIDKRTMAQLEENQANSTNEPLPTDPPVEFSDIFKMSRMYWLITGSCLAIYSSILPFNMIAGKLLQVKFDYSLDAADAMLGVPFIISAVCSPFLGFAVDIYGKRGYLMLISSCILICAHGIIGFTMVHPLVGLISIGVGYSLYAAAIWPSIAYVVEKKCLGTAYGITTAIQNAGLAFVPLISGAVYTITHDYLYVEVLFMGLAWIGVILGIWINMEDADNGNVLNRSHHQASEYQKALLADDQPSSA